MDISKQAVSIHDAEGSLSPNSPRTDVSQEIPPPVKRKGGRKPVYTTVQERKQRNRMAQAAFRERRTDYIKQLEETVKENEDVIKLLERNRRETTEECHMLRYKTSLLEDLLYEKGIDYQSELQSRSSRSLLSSPYATQQPANKQSAVSLSSPDVEQGRMPKFLEASERARAIKRRSKSNSVPSFGTSSNYSFDLKSESSSARVPTSMMTAFEPPGLMNTHFEYSNGTSQSMQSPLEAARFRFEETRIDPSMSGGPADPYYSMAYPHMGLHLEPERESRSNIFNSPSHRSFRSDISRPLPDPVNKYRCPRTHGSLPNAQSRHNLEPPHSLRQPGASPSVRDRLSMYEKPSYMLSRGLELDTMEMLDQTHLPEHFGMPHDSIG